MASVRVRAPARLHFGLLQLSEAYRTVYMGFGCSVSQPFWLLDLTADGTTPVDHISGVPAELRDYAGGVLDRLRRAVPVPPVRIEAAQRVPLHVGLGAKTSFGCALVAGLTRVLALPRAWRYYRRLLQRGGASGVGINTAVFGGLVLDAGHPAAECGELLPSSARRNNAVPARAAAWSARFLGRVIIARPAGVQGFAGTREAEFFRSNLPLSAAETRRVAAVGLYELIPALARQDANEFVVALGRLQDLGFKRLEWLAQSPIVFEARRFALSNGALGVALSSMGPTLAIFSPEPSRLARSMRHEFGMEATVSTMGHRLTVRPLTT